MNSDPLTTHDRLKLIAAWSMALAAAMVQWTAYLALDPASRPDQRRWLDGLMLYGHAAAVIGIALLPGLMWLGARWRLLGWIGRGLERLFRRGASYTLLLIASVAAGLYYGPYTWIGPGLALVSGLALLLLVLWLLYRHERFPYRRVVLSAAWLLCVIVLHQAFTALSDTYRWYDPGLLSGPAGGAIFSIAQIAALLVPLLLIPAAPHRTLNRLLDRLEQDRRVRGLTPVWLALAALGVTGYLVLNRDETHLALIVPLVGLLLGAIGLMAVRLLTLQAPLAARIAPHFSTLARGLETTLVILLGLIPWLALHASFRFVWGQPVARGELDFVHPTVAVRRVDYLLLLIVVVLIMRWRCDRSYAARLRESAGLVLRRFGGGWWLALVGWIALSALWALSARLALAMALHTLLAFTVALAAAELVRRGWARALLGSLLASAAFYSLYAILQTLNGAWLGQRWLGEVDHQPLLDQPYRALGLTAHPNTLGLFLMVGILAGLALLRQSIHKRRGLALVAGSLLLSALGLLTTASRVALLTAGIGFALVVLFLPRPMLHRRRERLLVLGAMALVLAFGLLISDLPRRIADTVQTPSKILDRLNWELTNPEAVIRDAPILGVGAHNLPLAIQRLETLAVHNLGANSYLVIWGELGIIGLGLFIAAAVSVIGWMRPRNGATLFTLGCALLGVFVAFMLDAYYLYPGTRLLMFWVLGVWWGLALQAYDRAVVELSLSTGAPENVARNSVSHSSSGRTTPGH